MSSVLPLPGDRSTRATHPGTATPALEWHPAYRPDIDGLRGIAVLSVLAVHSFPAWIQGGFIGVDIFFVLSGFLITGILFQSLEAGRFSYLDFYLRRVRRIFPALCLVLLACLVVSVFFTFPSASRQIGGHIAAGALFVSNIALWKEAGYFDVASEAKPLLHLWSLGIEEQFYLAWPLVVVFLYKHKRWALGLLCGGIAASFLLNLALVVDKPTGTFFLPPTRFWELMVGALLAWWKHQHGVGPVELLQTRLPVNSWSRRWMAEGWAIIGVVMMLAALWLIDKTDHFPGWWALLPTLGTFALLASGPGTRISRHLLSQPILRFYGHISYPLYLWHWPLLSFPVVMGIALTNEVRVMILIASVVLAVLTHELIEKPIRFGRSGPRTPLLWCALLAAIGVCGWGLKLSDGLLDTYPESVRHVASTEFRFDYSDYRVDRCMLRLDQGPELFAKDCITPTDPADRGMLLWGDSHAASLYPGLAHHLLKNKAIDYRLGQYTAARCPPLMEAPLLSSKHCASTNRFVLAKIAAQHPDTVVLAGHWSLYGADQGTLGVHLDSLRQTVAHLKSLGVRRVVVFGHLPTWTIPQPQVLLKQWQQSRWIPERSRAYINTDSLNTDLAVGLAMAGSGAEFVSPVAHLCNESGCQVSAVEQGIYYPVTNDDSHLTARGSVLLVQRAQSQLFEQAAP